MGGYRISELITTVSAIENIEERIKSLRARVTVAPGKHTSEAKMAAHLEIQRATLESKLQQFRAELVNQPGAQRVRAIARDEFADASASSLLRLRDRLSIRLDIEPIEVGGMTLEQFLTAWYEPTLSSESLGACKVDPSEPKEAGQDNGKLAHEAPEWATANRKIESKNKVILLRILAPNNTGTNARQAVDRIIKRSNGSLWLDESLPGNRVAIYFKEQDDYARANANRLQLESETANRNGKA